MIIIVHRINKIAQLSKLPNKFGAEIDVRRDNRNGRLYLNHESGTGDDLEDYLRHFCHAFIIFNIKEAGIEQRCINLAAKYQIPNDRYFLLDVEFPYLYRATRQESIRQIAVRYSEAEPLEFALAQKNFCDWIWIDTQTLLPLDEKIVDKLKGFQTCLVSPDRWARPKDIPVYQHRLAKLNFKPDAVMCGLEYINLWN